jgi:hypothetical protein
MKTVNSISGGKTSAYIAANYPADYNVFALVRTNDKNCLYPDAKVRQMVSDKIGKEFIGTLEQDNIITIMLDLENFIGQEIHWLIGDTFEEVIKKRGGYLPNLMARFCTTEMKMLPIIDWWRNNINEVCEMRIGFRANEMSRAKKIIERLNENGNEETKMIIGKSGSRNKWGTVEWRKPIFPLIKDSIFKDNIEQYWKDKPIRFKKGYYNNCVGCFHRNPIFLNKMSKEHKNKIDWFVKMEEKNQPNQFKKEVKYSEILKWKLQTELSFDDFNDCDSGYCGL